MNTKENIRERLQDLLSREQEALKIYTDIFGSVHDDFVRKRVEDVYKEEVKHVQYVRELLSYFE